MAREAFGANCYLITCETAVLIRNNVFNQLQAVGQMIFTSLGLAQHFCVIDFLKELPLLLYVRILYFHSKLYILLLSRLYIFDHMSVSSFVERQIVKGRRSG